MWSWVLVGCILLTLGMLMPDAGRATCGQKCDLSYSADIDGCRFQYGNDPADADALADCIQEAKDDHQNCLGDCANRAISPPSGGGWRGAPSSCGAAGQRNRARLTGCRLFPALSSPPVQRGNMSNGKPARLGFVDYRGCRWAQPRARLSHGRCDQPVPVAALEGDVGAGTGARRSGHCSSTRVRRPAASPGCALPR